LDCEGHIGGKNLKAAREAYRPDVKRDKKASVSASELFTNPKLDETFYAALKSTKNSNASMPNIDQLEKVYRKQTDVVLYMAKPLLFLLERKSKRSDKDTKALKTKNYSGLIFSARLPTPDVSTSLPRLTQTTSAYFPAQQKNSLLAARTFLEQSS
jgi:hypothetical protein